VSIDYILNETEENNIEFLKNVNLHFISGWDTSKTMRKCFQDSLPKDMALGYTTQGPHRQDFVFSVDKKKAAANLSRGQVKLLIILVFLSSYDVINRFSKRESLLLIDDIGSEVDEDNLKILFNIISKDKNQVILTAIDGSFLDQMNENLKQFKRINL
jgi:DNA replication and repair protein RecF